MLVRKQSLFEIGQELEQIFDAYEQLSGEEADSYIASALEQYFEKLGTDLNAKLDGYCGLIKTFEAKAKIRKEEAQRLINLAATDENNAKRLKKRLQDWMEITGNQKLETTFHKIWTQANGGLAPLRWVMDHGVIDGQWCVEWVPEAPPVDAGIVPEQFIRVIPEQRVIDNEAVRNALNEGEELDFVKFGERGFSLRIK
ncbi:MAG: siphovirus Gp157 family protein [Fimbriimonadaceae bacterium]|nr:siphovirus Gp157 family protein [Fimbriimonadaceae bacterium]